VRYVNGKSVFKDCLMITVVVLKCFEDVAVGARREIRGRSLSPEALAASYGVGG